MTNLLSIIKARLMENGKSIASLFYSSSPRGAQGRHCHGLILSGLNALGLFPFYCKIALLLRHDRGAECPPAAFTEGKRTAQLLRWEKVRHSDLQGGNINFIKHFGSDINFSI